MPVCVALSPPRYPINVWWPVPVLHTCRCVWLQSPPRVRCLWLCPRRAVGCVWSCFDLSDNLALRYHPSTRPIPGKLKPSTEFPFIFPSPCRTNHQIPLRPPPPSFTSRPPSHMMEFGVHVLSAVCRGGPPNQRGFGCGGHDTAAWEKTASFGFFGRLCKRFLTFSGVPVDMKYHRLRNGRCERNSRT